MTKLGLHIDEGGLAVLQSLNLSFTPSPLQYQIEYGSEVKILLRKKQQQTNAEMKAEEIWVNNKLDPDLIQELRMWPLMQQYFCATFDSMGKVDSGS